MEKIKKLSSHMTNLIAAGEVVERPASVVKELVENSLDAKAKNITIEIQKGGITYIRITDDGHGIDHSEIETAFDRYATSKLFNEEDLLEINTMGFRGEALAAIAAVSKVSLISRTKENEFGGKVVVEGGNKKENTSVGCPLGTTIIVRDLFYNTPARFKFLRKDSTEGAYIQTSLTKLSLSRPDVSFSFIKDGKTIFHTPGDHSLHTAIYCLIGKEIASSLIEISYKVDDVIVHGFVSQPTVFRANRSSQHFFVNQRPVRNLTIQSALEEAFRGHLVTGKFPIAFININVTPSNVDVNVHPAKVEIKFAFERRIFEAVYYGVKTAIAKHNENAISVHKKTEQNASEVNSSDIGKSEITEKNLDVKADSMMREESKIHNTYSMASNTQIFENNNKDMRTYQEGILNFQIKRNDESRPETVLAQNASFKPIYVDVFDEQSQEDTHKSNEDSDNLKEMPIGPSKRLSDDSNISVKSADVDENTDVFRVLGEVFGTYILIETDDELIILDKHAAHERIKYDEIKMLDEHVSSQTLLEPVITVYPAEGKEMLLEHIGMLNKLGFEIEDFGGASIIIRALPDYYDSETAITAISEIVEALNMNKTPEDKKENIIKLLACQAAIKGGSDSDIMELEALTRAILSGKAMLYCPHGRPIIDVITRTALEKKFLRIT